jgi:hypothetical protein
MVTGDVSRNGLAWTCQKGVCGVDNGPRPEARMGLER